MDDGADRLHHRTRHEIGGHGSKRRHAEEKHEDRGHECSAPHAGEADHDADAERGDGEDWIEVQEYPPSKPSTVAGMERLLLWTSSDNTSLDLERNQNQLPGCLSSTTHPAQSAGASRVRAGEWA